MRTGICILILERVCLVPFELAPQERTAPEPGAAVRGWPAREVPLGDGRRREVTLGGGRRLDVPFGGGRRCKVPLRGGRRCEVPFTPRNVFSFG